LLLGAVIITAISTAVTLVVTDALNHDDNAKFPLAQDARDRFDREMDVLSDVQGSRVRSIYLKLFEQRRPADREYTSHHWDEAERGYTRLTSSLDARCRLYRASSAAEPTCGAPHNARPAPPVPRGALPTRTEQEGRHGVNTYENPHTAGGMGPSIGPNQTVAVTCKIYDPAIVSVMPDGYWYRIASPPWNNKYFAPANTFMNGDPPNGPYVNNTDFAVPDC
jgi:hypothetical protein